MNHRCEGVIVKLAPMSAEQVEYLRRVRASAEYDPETVIGGPPRPVRRVTVAFRWYDLWVGAYYDRASRVWHVCPVPTICVRIRRRP